MIPTYLEGQQEDSYITELLSDSSDEVESLTSKDNGDHDEFINELEKLKLTEHKSSATTNPVSHLTSNISDKLDTSNR